LEREREKERERENVRGVLWLGIEIKEIIFKTTYSLLRKKWMNNSLVVVARVYGTIKNIKSEPSC
jgi:hypothetical protein